MGHDQVLWMSWAVCWAQRGLGDVTRPSLGLTASGRQAVRAVGGSNQGLVATVAGKTACEVSGH